MGGEHLGPASYFWLLTEFMLKNLTIKKASELLAKKEISAVELAGQYFDLIADKNKDVFAYLEIFAQSAKEKAEKIDSLRAAGEKLPALAGIPLAVKDNILIAGQKSSSASKILENFTAPYDASVIARLKEAGVVFLGRTNMDEFAMGSSTENSAFGPTKNPYDFSRIPGGSSGGSAAAVAADMCVFALGSDTGGSIRQPASFCGVAGLKPTYGAVSRYGLMAMASSLDQIGPLAKTVEDAEIVFSAICGADKRDSTSVDYEYKKLEDFKLQGLKVGIVKEFLGAGLSGEVAESIRLLLKKLALAGAEITEVSLPHAQEALACYYVIMPCEVSANMARYDGIRYGLSKREKGGGMWDIYFKSRAQGLGDEVKRRIMLGTYALSAGYYEAYYLQAQKVRNLIKEDFKKAFAQADILLTPTAPTTAFKLGEKTSDPLTMYLEDVYTVPINLAGLPALSLPIGRDSLGLPIGLQLVAGHFQENKIMALGKAIERL